MPEINRALLHQTFEKLRAHSRGVRVDIDFITDPKPHNLNCYLTGGNLLVFDETKARGDFHLAVRAEDGVRISTKPLGGIAVGNRLVFPRELPAPGEQPRILLGLVCPEPSQLIDITDPKCPPAICSQPIDDAPAYLSLTEEAIIIPGAPEHEQPLHTATQYALRVMASRDELFHTPSWPYKSTV